MDIGLKLQEARIKSNLTQEQVADQIGVSRQTISNWENERTYPDIKNVVLLSDIFEVSLDYLLKNKEDNTMQNYINYLEENTDIVKGKNKLSISILVSTYLLIWAISLITFWFFISASDAMGYSLMFLWIILPVTTLTTSIIIGKNKFFGKFKWLSSIILGILYMLAEYATFQLSNMIAFDKINFPNISMFLAGAIITQIGLGIGYLINKKTNKKNAIA